MLEKYIYTPEETEDRRKKNQLIMEIFERTPERKEKHDFARSLNRQQATSPIVPYLSKKKFEEKFAKRKEENALKTQANENALRNKQDGDDDGFPF